MHTLDKSLRSALENTILAARSAAEEAAQIVLEALGVGEKVPFPHLNESERLLRRKLRSHGRQLGDWLYEEGKQTIDALTEEVAYQHWHRMLFARFLAENDLLMDDDPVSPISLTIEECNDLAPSLGARNGWDLAARYASRMLPQIFLNDSPIFSLEFPIERQKVLEQLVSSIPQEVFHASDSLGWVYQFWQTKRKKDINDSGVKIGARELPAVTQLFTEPYMVSFLLDNSLGAWWAAKRLSSHDLATATDEQELRDKAYVDHLPLEYLRFVKDEETESWKPAGGTFDAWPKHLSEFKMLDPCCGSGHFLVATLQMLVPMRMELEGLTADEAIQRVLEENIHGLELDQRCVELAAFALAFAAWTYPGSSGYRQLPPLHIACSGQAIHISDEELIKLSNGNHELYNALEDLRNKFQQAPILGSLIDPKSSMYQNELFSLDWEEVGPLLDSVLRKGQDDDLDEAGIVAQGLAKAASLLAGTYHLVATNVPYLARGKQSDILRNYCGKRYPDSAGNLATTFIERMSDLCTESGWIAAVTLQDWIFQPTYKALRLKLLKENTWGVFARLGAKAFQTPMWDFNIQLLILGRSRPIKEHRLSGMDASEPQTVEEKAVELVNNRVIKVRQENQQKNPDGRISLEDAVSSELLLKLSYAYKGITTGDDLHYRRVFWESFFLSKECRYLQSTVVSTTYYGGLSGIILYDEMTIPMQPGVYLRAEGIRGKVGVMISQMSYLNAAIYVGESFDTNASAIIPNSYEYLAAIWCFCASQEYNEAVRHVDQSLKVTNATLVKIP